MQPENRNRRAFCFAVDGLSIALMTIGLYVFLMQHYPIIYGGDTITRLVNPDRIMSGHQLPLLQALIYLSLQLHYSPTAIFLLMAFISAAACMGMYALALVLTNNRRAAWLVAILYIAHPFILYYSRVPYQEPLLLAGIAWGLYFLFRPLTGVNRLLASLFFAVACLSRYEGWIAAFAAAIFDIWRTREKKGKIGFTSLCQSLFLFGWAPAIWIALNKDLSPAGTYVLDLTLQWGRLYRSYFIIKSTLWWTESAVVLIALIGFVYSWIDSRRRQDVRFRVLLGMLALLMVVLIFSGHGIEPNPTRLVTEREAFLPVSILVLYAGIGGDLLVKWIGQIYRQNLLVLRAIPLFILIVLAGYSLDSGFHRIDTANADPDLKTDYEVARYLSEKHSGGLVFAAPLPEGPMKDYLKSVERWSGPAGRIKAMQLLEQAETTPLDYQRVLVYSWMGKGRLISGDRLRGMDLRGIESFLRDQAIGFIIVFSDFTPAAEYEKYILNTYVASRAPEAEIHNSRKIGRIYAVRFQPNETKEFQRVRNAQ